MTSTRYAQRISAISKHHMASSLLRKRSHERVDVVLVEPILAICSCTETQTQLRDLRDGSSNMHAQLLHEWKRGGNAVMASRKIQIR